jgi:hypothetical protein
MPDRIVYGQGELGYISSDSRRYQLTWEDLLWLARMVKGEAGTDYQDGAATLWAIASRYFAINRQGTLYRLAQDYSQPINPRWQEDGLFCRPGGRDHGTVHCSPQALQRRRETFVLQWDEINPRITRLVYDWATARVQNPVSRAVHWATPKVSNRANSGRHRTEGSDNGWEFVWDSLGRTFEFLVSALFDLTRGNTYWSTNRSRSWPASHIKIVFQDRSASDGNISEPEPYEDNAGSTSASTNTASELEPPPNNIFNRTVVISSDRTSPPSRNYKYGLVAGPESDANSGYQLTENQTRNMIQVSSSRFRNQLNSLKQMSALQVTKTLPAIVIWAYDETGNRINLNETIFNVSPFDRSSYGEPERFPERPLASIVGFQLQVEENNRGGGTTAFNNATLQLKVHNPTLITLSHPQGKHLARMMVQGCVIRVRYGIEGASSDSETEKQAFQWKEEDFQSVTVTVKINSDMTTEYNLRLMPVTHALLQQIMIGQSIPVDELGRLTSQDIDDIINQVTSTNRENISDGQVDQLRRRLSLFREQLNSRSESPGPGLVRRQDGTLGLQIHQALRNQDIFDMQETEPVVPIPDMVEAFQSIQSILLTKRYSRILQDACYSTVNRGVSTNVANLGPIISEIMKPEIDFIARLSAESGGNRLGEIFSADETNISNNRSNVNLVFGNFNARAGQYANKPISTFPLNVDGILSSVRSQRAVGQFGGNLVQFFGVISGMVADRSAYDVPQQSNENDDQNRRITPSYVLTIPTIRFIIYPDPTSDDSWIFYIYDTKEPTVRLRNAMDALSDYGRRGVRPSDLQIKRLLDDHGIPWVQMGDEFAHIKQFNAETTTNDAMFAHYVQSAHRQSVSLRDIDGTPEIPSGVSPEFFNSFNQTPQQRISNLQYVPNLQLSVQSILMLTSYYAAPVYVFFPIPRFSSIYIVEGVRHDIKNQGMSLTNLNLRVDVSNISNLPF